MQKFKDNLRQRIRQRLSLNFSKESENIAIVFLHLFKPSAILLVDNPVHRSLLISPVVSIYSKNNINHIGFII